MDYEVGLYQDGKCLCIYPSIVALVKANKDKRFSRSGIQNAMADGRLYRGKYEIRKLGEDFTKPKKKVKPKASQKINLETGMPKGAPDDSD